MDVKDFAQYVVNNMHRATLSNALSISAKLDTEGFYKFPEFLDELYKYAIECLSSKRIDTNKCYKILALTNETLTKYNSTFNYNKVYLIDDFLIKLWYILDKEM